MYGFAFCNVPAQLYIGGFYRTTTAGGGSVNKESVAVAAAAVGNATAQGMTTDSTVGASSYDGFAFCNVPAQLYIGGFYRTTTAGGVSGNATAAVPAALLDAAAATLSVPPLPCTRGRTGPTDRSS